MSEQKQRGVLYPRELPQFSRFEPTAALEHAVRWFWVPEWNLPNGEISRQQILPFPACNLVVEASGVSFVGPATTRSVRTLEGQGWAVGALLRPAAAHALVENLTAVRDSSIPVDAPSLHVQILEVMSNESVSGEFRRAHAVNALSEWLHSRVPEAEPGGEAELANQLELLLASPEIIRVDQLPEPMHTSLRTLQRLTERYFGLSLHSMIRRRRLQEGAERLRGSESLGLADLATELGYADHAHFTKDFKELIGVTPSDYRASTRYRPAPGLAADGG